LDKIDHNIISLLLIDYDNKHISNELKIPLSTIQRRVRNILSSGIVTVKVQPNFKMLGIKKGLIHVYLQNGNIKDINSQVAKMQGFLSTSIHVGNSDIVGEFVYKDTEDLVDAISNIKHIEGVDKVLWSEEISTLSAEPHNIRNSFRNMV